MIQKIPGDTHLARFALVRGALTRGWTRIVGAPRNAIVFETLRDLAACGVAVEYHRGAIVVKGEGFNRDAWERCGSVLHGATDDARRIGGAFFRVPGDARLAGVWIAAAILAQRPLRLERVFVTRALGNALALLARAGARIQERRLEHRVSEIVVEPSALYGFDAHASVTRHGVALLALVATAAHGTSRFPRSPQAQAAVNLLRALGATVDEKGDAFTIDGPQRLRGGTVRCAGDLECELAAAVASLGSDGDVLLEDAETMLLVYPHMLEELHAWSEVCA